MNEPIMTGDRDELPADKVDTKFRLGFMDLEQFCTDNKFCYYLVWYAGYGNELSCQVNLGGRAWGAYAEKICEAKIKMHGKKGIGLAGKTFLERDAVLQANAEQAEGDSEEEKQAAALAKECGVASSWAIFRDGAVYEFGSATKMDALPMEIIDKIGGSTGVAAAAKAVLAAVKLSALAKAKKN